MTENLRLLIAINAAQMEGLHFYAAALMQLYKQRIAEAK